MARSNKINFLKNGFYMRLYNQQPRNKSSTMMAGSQGTLPTNTHHHQKHTRYMSNAFDRNKLGKKLSVGSRNHTTTTWSCFITKR